MLRPTCANRRRNHTKWSETTIPDDRLEQAEAECRALLARAPGCAPAHTLLGNLLKRRGRHKEAIAQHREAVRLDSGSGAALADLASSLLAGGASDDAILIFAELVRVNPGIAALHANLATALMSHARFEEATEGFRRALAIETCHLPALCNLGVCLRLLGRPREAIEPLREALRVAPGHLEAEWNLALALLMAGQQEEGWARYEARRRLPGFAIEHPEGMAWDGRCSPEATLLVHAEQGLGDTLQFLRYLPAAQRRVGRLVFECQAPLAGLLSGIAGVDQLLSRGVPRPPYDGHAPLMSLPFLLGCGVLSMPEGLTTISPAGSRVARWRDRLACFGGRKIGIAWQGNPQYKADAQRSIPLRHFVSLAALPGVCLVSLQKHHGLEQLVDWPASLPLVNFAQELDTGTDAFLDTAALLMSLECVICSDSALAHLAGACGIEVWLLLPAVPDWRWGLEGERSPWYPMMRMFRQRCSGDWDELFSRLARALHAER